VDSGVVEGDTVSGSFDSMIAKIIVTGATRTQAIERARRALAETEISGIPTVLPFHRAVLESTAFAPVDPAQPFSVHTRWIETAFAESLSQLRTADVTGHEADSTLTERVVVEVGGKRIEVVLPAGLGLTSARTRTGLAPRRARRAPAPRAAANGTTLASPMQGTIVKVAVDDGAVVVEGDLVVVLEAMKMEQPLVAHRAGRVSGLSAVVGGSVSAGMAICDIVDS
jgi:acetyl-CoA/propionyl-CoA carboxylase biotin carboxyl carrier protein